MINPHDIGGTLVDLDGIAAISPWTAVTGGSYRTQTHCTFTLIYKSGASLPLCFTGARGRYSDEYSTHRQQEKDVKMWREYIVKQIVGDKEIRPNPSELHQMHYAR